MDFGESCKISEFKAAASAIEERVRRTWAARSCSRDVARSVVMVFWNNECGYKSAYSFFEVALRNTALSGRYRVGVVTGVFAPVPRAQALEQELAVGGLRAISKPANEPGSGSAASAPPIPSSVTLPAAPVQGEIGTATSATRPSSTCRASQWLMVKCIEMARTDAKPCSKAAAGSAWETGALLGQGTFGRVHAAIQTHTGLPLAIKTLKDGDANEFMREVCLCAGLHHPNVVQLVDVFVRPKKGLVFVYAGPNLHVSLVAGVVPRDELRSLSGQLCEGLAYLHDNFVTHSDVKPRNLSWDHERKHLTILDLGNAVISLPGFRSSRELMDIQHSRLRYGTLFYRAPEVVCGDGAWGCPVDCWASALVMVEVWQGGGGPAFQVDSVTGLLLQMFGKLGSPTGDDLAYFRALPHFSDQYPKSPPPRSVLCALGGSVGGVPPNDVDDVVRSLMALNPANRMTAPIAACRLRSPYISTTPALPMIPSTSKVVDLTAGGSGVVVLGVASGGMQPNATTLVTAGDGLSTFEGARGPFSLREGWLEPGLVKWLKEDLCEQTWSWTPDPLQTDRWIEFGQKLEICGHVEGLSTKKGQTLNGKAASLPLPARLVSFALALKRLNKPFLEALDAEIKSTLGSLDGEKKKQIGKNGSHLANSSALDWCFTLGAIQCMRSNQRLDPVHFDGGASFVHLGLTLAGDRSLLMRHKRKAGGPEEELRLPMTTGHVYLGGLCGPTHYIEHHVSTDLHDSPNLGPIEVVVLLRSACFRASRSSTAQAGPTPLVTWKALAPVVSTNMCDHAWLLPSLADCQDELAKLNA